MTVEHTYRVGDHLFALDIPSALLSEKELSRYAPFRAVRCSGEELLFSLRFVGDVADGPLAGTPTAEFEDENGLMTLSPIPGGGIAVELTAPSGTRCCRLCIDAGFRTASAWAGGTPGERHYALDTALMLLYAFASAEFDTLLLHASVVEYDGRGYIFLGKSGTGKSTHSRLWTGNIAGATLLNDDNPVVRIIDGTVYVYGSPWSGKTPCYVSRKVEAGGIVRLQQAPHNRLTRLPAVRAYAALLPSCSSMKWDHEMASALHSTISHVIARVPVYSLECRPDREAALMCCEKVAGLRDG